MQILQTSQPEKLAARLVEAGVAHGEVVTRADIPGVFVYAGTLYWCETGPIKVHAKTGTPDNKPMPKIAPVPTGMPTNLSSAYYNIIGAKISPNGKIAVDVTEAVFEPAH